MDAVSPSRVIGIRRSVSWSSTIFVSFAFALTGIAVLPLDIPVASYFKGRELAAPLREAIEICEAFGHGFGAFLIVVAVGVLAPQKRRFLLWIICGSLGSGMVANWLKLCIHRTRPTNFELLNRTFWNTFDQDYSAGAAMQSFPSAHTATAVGLAVMLSSLFPSGRWFFSVLALLVGVQRIVVSAHFPSDVCAGATIGWLMGTACVTFMRCCRQSDDAIRC